jgi:TonB family protein
VSQSKPEVYPESRAIPDGEPRVPQSFELTLLDLPTLPVSLLRQTRNLLQDRQEPSKRSAQPQERLPISDQRVWFLDLPARIQEFLAMPKAAPASSGSQAGRARDLWQDYKQNPYSWANSLLIHLFVLTAMLLPFALRQLNNPMPLPKKLFDLTPLVLTLPHLHGNAAETHGGGGGGDRSPLPASRGKLLTFARTQFTPPRVTVPKVAPLLPMPATLLGPPELKLPAMKLDMPFGDPLAQAGPPSQGPGTGGGIGPGNGTGIGPGDGGGYGPGSDGGCCGGPFTVGMGGVSAPIPIYSPEPAYSEEARKAKFGGIVTLWILVDAQGIVRDIKVAKALGMGLDEEAVKTVNTWKFKPALRQGSPVPVRVQVEVSFRLF